MVISKLKIWIKSFVIIYGSLISMLYFVSFVTGVQDGIATIIFGNWMFMIVGCWIIITNKRIEKEKVI